MIQAFHRYSCAPRRSTRRVARTGWIDELADEDVDLPPHPGDLPELPWAWIDGLNGHEERCRRRRPRTPRAVSSRPTPATAGRALDAVIRSLADVRAVATTPSSAPRAGLPGKPPPAGTRRRRRSTGSTAGGTRRRRRSRVVATEASSGRRCCGASARRSPIPTFQRLRDELGDRETTIRARTGERIRPGCAGRRNLPEEFWARPELDPDPPGRPRPARSRRRRARRRPGAGRMLTPPTLTIDTGVGSPPASTRASVSSGLRRREDGARQPSPRPRGDRPRPTSWPTSRSAPWRPANREYQ